MRKLLLSVLVLMPVIGQAKTPKVDKVIRKAQKIVLQLQAHRDVIDRNDLRDIKAYLNDVKDILDEYGDMNKPLNTVCDGVDLVDLSNRGRVLHSFSFMSDCEYAKRRLARGRSFCDQTSLYSNRAQFINQFVFSSECEDAMPRVDLGKNFCDFGNGNILKSRTGQTIHQFTFRSQCQAALN